MIAKNPPPICFGVPYLKEALSLCLKFHDLDVKDNSLSGCVDLIAELGDVKLVKVKLGCFKTAANMVFINEVKYMEFATDEFNKLQTKKRTEWW